MISRRWTIIASIAAVLSLLVVPVAYAATFYVSETGIDTTTCGFDSLTACRSIGQAIELAAPGDTILVGPGRYGDLNLNGLLGEAGEERGAPGCSCVLAIDKPLVIMSSAGAAVTVIDGRTVNAIQNVLVITVGGEFGRPGKGFTVTPTAHADASGINNSSGIVLDAAAVMVRGNQVVFRLVFARRSNGVGIRTVNDAAVRIEGNLVMNWSYGIQGRGSAIVSKNQVVDNDYGITTTGGSVLGNVVSQNGVGLMVRGPTTVRGNDIHANMIGMRVAQFSGVITGNNFRGTLSIGTNSQRCGVINDGVAVLNVSNNYWGSAAGPSGGSSDKLCNNGPGMTFATPVATQPIAVTIIKP